MTGAVDDDVTDALARLAPAEDGPAVDLKVIKPGVAAAEHEQAGNASRADGVQVASESVQQASSEGGA